MKASTLLQLIILVAFSATKGKIFDKGDAKYWRIKNENLLNRKVEHLKNLYGSTGLKNKAKNVIFFLGDGMGLSTVTAARLYKGNVDKMDPEAGFLSFEHFPSVSLAKVNSLDMTVADSAATATSYLCGVKTNQHNIGVTGNVKPNDCEASKNNANRVTSIIRWAQKHRKLTGVVTTTKITDATPAVSYAHSANRNWEHNTNGAHCEDIAMQMIFGKTGDHINVIFGGGRGEFLPNVTSKHTSEVGHREDGVNLIHSWIKRKQKQGHHAKYIQTKDELSKIDDKKTDYVLGLFASSDLQYNLDKEENSTEPSLYKMTEKAIQILQKSDEGFVLLVEGGRIDDGHHENRAKKALDETYQFHKAINKALKMINAKETLVIVTADHSHPLTINGYQSKGSDVLGETFDKYTTLLYGTGPGFSREDSFNLDSTDKDYRQKSTVFLEQSAHAGEDVPVYATGPGSQLLFGVYDQTFIPYVVSASARIGPLSNKFSKTKE